MQDMREVYYRCSARTLKQQEKCLGFELKNGKDCKHGLRGRTAWCFWKPEQEKQ